MSMMKKVKVVCEECGKEFEAERYDSINVDLDPELREKFLFDELYVFKCPHCGHIHYKPYPVLYHDMKHKFMVQSGNITDVLSFINQKMPDNDIGDLTRNMMKDYVKTGATSTILATEKVVALENGLDHRIATITRVIATAQYANYANEHDMSQPESSYLCYDDDGDLSVIINIIDKKTNQPTCVCQKFNKEMYDEIAKEFNKEIDLACDYLFTDDSAMNFMNASDKREFLSKINRTFALIENLKGNEFFVSIPLFIPDDYYKVGDCIVANVEDYPFTCVIKELCEFTPVNAPFDLEMARKTKILRKAVECFETSGNSDDELDNAELLEKLKEFNEDINKMPFDLVRSSDAIIGMVSSLTFPTGQTGDDGEFEFDESWLEKGHIEERMITYDYEGHTLLCIYLDQKDVPKEDEGEPVSKMVFNLDDLFLHVIQTSEKYEGVIINPEKEKIIIATPYLLDEYLPGRIMNNDKRFIKMLEKMTDSEKGYIGKENYKYITMVYFDNKNPQQISKELNIPIERVGQALTDGYAKIKDIAKTK